MAETEHRAPQGLPSKYKQKCQKNTHVVRIITKNAIFHSSNCDTSTICHSVDNLGIEKTERILKLGC